MRGLQVDDSAMPLERRMRAALGEAQITVGEAAP
jgi:hypothetical protein